MSLTHVKNQHNKKISCMRKQVSALEASIDKKDSRRKALENELHDLNEWVLELDNERITAETERKGAVANECSAKRKYARAQSKCRSAKKKYAQKYAHMESKCSELQNEIEQLNDWVFELDNKKSLHLIISEQQRRCMRVPRVMPTCDCRNSVRSDFLEKSWKRICYV